MFETSTPPTNTNSASFASSPSSPSSFSYGASPGENSGERLARPLPSRSDLQAAFNWLVQQPESVRKLATDTDKLMSMFQRATRPAPPASSGPAAQPDGQATWSSEAPASAAAFVQDLRQINQALQQFEGTPAQTVQPISAMSSGTQVANSNASKTQAAPVKWETSPARPAAPSTATLSIEALHPRSQAMLGEVREKLNLSSDAEALNILIATGFKSLKSLIS